MYFLFIEVLIRLTSKRAFLYQFDLYKQLFFVVFLEWNIKALSVHFFSCHIDLLSFYSNKILFLFFPMSKSRDVLRVTLWTKTVTENVKLYGRWKFSRSMFKLSHQCLTRIAIKSALPKSSPFSDYICVKVEMRVTWVWHAWFFSDATWVIVCNYICEWNLLLRGIFFAFHIHQKG